MKRMTVSPMAKREQEERRMELDLAYIVRVLLKDLVAAPSGRVARELAPELGDSVQGCGRFQLD